MGLELALIGVWSERPAESCGTSSGVGTAEVCRELEAGGEVWTGLGIPGSVAGPGNAIGMAGVAIEVELRGDDIGPGSWGC